MVITDAQHEPVGGIREEDACLFFNYRADRGREMTQVLTESPLKLHFTTMTQYDKALPVPFVLSKEHPNNILANVMVEASNGRTCEWLRRKNTRTSPTFSTAEMRSPTQAKNVKMVASPKVATPYDLEA